MLISYNYLVKGVLYVCVSCNPKLFIILSEKKKPIKGTCYKLGCILKSLVPPHPKKKFTTTTILHALTCTNYINKEKFVTFRGHVHKL